MLPAHVNLVLLSATVRGMGSDSLLPSSSLCTAGFAATAAAAARGCPAAQTCPAPAGLRLRQVPNVMEFAGWVGRTKRKPIYVTGEGRAAGRAGAARRQCGSLRGDLARAAGRRAWSSKHWPSAPPLHSRHHAAPSAPGTQPLLWGPALHDRPRRPVPDAGRAGGVRVACFGVGVPKSYRRRPVNYRRR